MSIINNASNLKHKTMIMLTYSSGLRVSETVKLKAEDIKRDSMRLRINQGKGGKDRYTVLSKVSLKHLEKYWKAYKPGIWLFPGVKKNNPMSIRACQHAFYKAKDNAGIKKEAGIHTLRHSFATHCLETGMGIFQLQKFLGHKSLKSTLIYVHLQEEKTKADSPLDVYLEADLADCK